MLARLEAVFTEIEVFTVSAFEPGTIYRKHLAAVTPAGNRRGCKNMLKENIQLNGAEETHPYLTPG